MKKFEELLKKHPPARIKRSEELRESILNRVEVEFKTNRLPVRGLIFGSIAALIILGCTTFLLALSHVQYEREAMRNCFSNLEQMREDGGGGGGGGIGLPSLSSLFGRSGKSRPMSTVPEQGYQEHEYIPPYLEDTATDEVQPDAEEENKFLSPIDHPLSTFSIDVDTASYTIIRQALKSGFLPTPGSVRIEEMINYFSYIYPNPDPDTPFSVTTEIGECPWNKKNKLLLVGMQGYSIPEEQLPPSNLVFLIDVSGSMDSPEKLPLLIDSFKLLVNQLSKTDRIAIVVYAGRSGVLLDSTPCSDKKTVLDALGSLQAGGSTAGSEGITTAYEIARKNFIEGGNNRVILATDGDFNVGIVDRDELKSFIENKRKEGVFLTTLGFGMSDYRDDIMETLADKGNGNYHHIDTLHEANKVFSTDLKGNLFTIAKDVKLQLEFNPKNVKGYRLIGYENRRLRKEDFENDSIDAGELGSGHTVTALYELELGDLSSAHKNLKYSEIKINQDEATANELANIKLRYKKPDEEESKLIEQPAILKADNDSEESRNLKLAASIAEFGMMLKHSLYLANPDPVRLVGTLQKLSTAQDDGINELISLIEKFEALSKKARER